MASGDNLHVKKPPQADLIISGGQKVHRSGCVVFGRDGTGQKVTEQGSRRDPEGYLKVKGSSKRTFTFTDDGVITALSERRQRFSSAKDEDTAGQYVRRWTGSSQSEKCLSVTKFEDAAGEKVQRLKGSRQLERPVRFDMVINDIKRKSKHLSGGVKWDVTRPFLFSYFTFLGKTEQSDVAH